MNILSIIYKNHIKYILVEKIKKEIKNCNPK